ncbi:MAG: DNA helicase RecQ [Muribaculaceae bacterium]
MSDLLKDSALSVLKKFYGYTSFYPVQYEVIEWVMQGNDAIVLMPTGGGKSVCFQIPALLKEGCAIVVTPLIALMQDQVDAMQSNGVPAAAINSAQSENTNREILQEVFNGRIKLLYISPERLLSDIGNWSQDINISLIAIDEAHCISQWGHDFRPEYTRLSLLKQHFKNVPIMALTATADRLTREDISHQLGIDDAKLFITSFDRKNLSLNVVTNASGKQKMQRIQHFIELHQGESGIIYCLSRKSTEKMAEQLKALGYEAACYHAGMNSAVRETVQRQFLNDDVQIMCATVAFGMGINKSNIRWVIHSNMPKTIESYYQEIGRAGRDGAKADTLMFYSFGDMATLMSFAKDSGQQSLNIEKLQRMQQYAESHVCRRRILLSYFNERYECDCGNCDVCNDPPERIDGTTISQMALSAIIRTNEGIGVNMLIDILRGSHKAEISEKQYDKIKTYGIGRDLSFSAWNAYLLQILQLGLIEVAYNDGNHLKVTEYGRDILKGKIRIELSKFYYEEKIKAKPKKVREVVEKVDASRQLFNDLKKLRLSIARAEGVPPYIVFSDKVLEIIASALPTTKEEFGNLYGVGEKKVERYWRAFTQEIIRYKSLF